MSAYDDTEDLAPLLGVAVQLQARNTEYNLDLTGRVTHLGERGLITTFPVEIPAGTVMFSIMDLRPINATVRGLIRVRSQSDVGEQGGFRTVADFVDLNEDERHKIVRMLSPNQEELEYMPPRGAPLETAPAQSVPFRTRPAPSEPSRSQAWPRVNVASVIWTVLAVIFYSLVLLLIIAIFPQGRAAELAWLAKAAHAIDRLWPGFSHLFGSK